MCWSASMPLIPLILTSRNTRSGYGPFFTNAIPCSPFAASETLYFRDESTRESEYRISASSSMTRIVGGLAAMSDMLEGEGTKQITYKATRDFARGAFV